jgi:uncharacterized protein (DUF2252 family)
MASDLATTPSSGITAQLCGDAHLSNFGLFLGPDRRLVFDINDFDETHPGPFEWDVKRLAASAAIAAEAVGFTAKQADRAASEAARGYRDAIGMASVRSPLEIHYFRLEADELLPRLKGAGRRTLAKSAKQARMRDSLRAFAKLTDVIDGRRVIVPHPPLVVRFEEERLEREMDRIRRFLLEYLTTLPFERRRLLERYRVIDGAHKVVGVGSVGTRCIILLLQTDDGQPLFMQFKEATRSVLERHTQPSEFENSGERVVRGQRMMQTTGDILLGWSRLESEEGRQIDFYFRQLWDGKGAIAVEALDPPLLRRYAWFCGATLGLAHARAGDAAVIEGYLGGDATFDKAITEFARRYIKINAGDHAAHLAAIKAGALPAEVGV